MFEDSRSFVRRGREGREGATLAIHPCNGCGSGRQGPLPNATAILKQPNSSGTVQSCRGWAKQRLHLLSHLLHLGPQSTWPDKGSPQWPCFNHLSLSTLCTINYLVHFPSHLVPILLLAIAHRTVHRQGKSGLPSPGAGFVSDDPRPKFHATGRGCQADIDTYLEFEDRTLETIDNDTETVWFVCIVFFFALLEAKTNFLVLRSSSPHVDPV